METIISICLPAITGLIIYFVTELVQHFKAQTNSELMKQYLDLLNTMIVEGIQAINQEYVDKLKASGTFDAAAQTKALELATASVLNNLSTEAKALLEQAVGDLESYIKVKIESTIRTMKGV